MVAGVGPVGVVWAGLVVRMRLTASAPVSMPMSPMVVVLRGGVAIDPLYSICATGGGFVLAHQCWYTAGVCPLGAYEQRETPMGTDLLTAIGSGSLAASVVAMILRGWLMPARSVQQVIDLYKDQVATERARGDQWREAALASEQARQDLANQVERLLAIGQKTLRLVSHTGGYTYR
jgi:hypothetical protein